MQIKVFRAANLQSALEEIREQLGPNASVLRTRQCRDGWMGWLGRSYVEVTASAQGDSLSADRVDIRHRVRSGLPTDVTGDDNRVGPRLHQTESGLHPVTPQTRPDASLSGIDARSLESDYTLTADPLAQYRTGLLSLGVRSPVVDRWIRSTSGFVAQLGEGNELSWMEQLRRSVSREIRLSGEIRFNPGERRVVALVGPTGVGKTTTVAKLAAGFRTQNNRRVGLLTIDTFRIAAVQQLQAYAQIMDLPMSVVESAEQMPDAIKELGDVDLILIDTAGRSPKGDMHVENLASMLRSAQPDETHLVVSATSTAAVVQSAIEGFAPAHPTAAILTKLDETPYTAGVLSAMTSSREFVGVPISYVTHGQHVPEDIAVATREQLIERLLPGAIEMPQFEAA